MTELKQLYFVWWEMRRRCRDPRSLSYARYGAKGVTVCPEWEDFDVFRHDMGPRPKGHSIERIDNSLGYSKENCKWATAQEQNSNRSNCIYVHVGGERMTLKEACRRLKLTYRAVHKRITERGWEVDRALSTPVGRVR